MPFIRYWETFQNSNLADVEPGIGLDGNPGYRKTQTNKLVWPSGGYAAAWIEIDSISNNLIPFMRSNVVVFNGTMSSRAWLIGIGNGFLGYCGIVPTADGALHLVAGSGFDSGANSANWWRSGGPSTDPCDSGWTYSYNYELGSLTRVIDSSEPGLVDVNGDGGWNFYELSWTQCGTCRFWLNGVLIFSVASPLPPLLFTDTYECEDPPGSGFVQVKQGPVFLACDQYPVSWAACGGASFGASFDSPFAHFWTGRVGFVAGGFDRTTSIGKVRIERLRADVEGARLDSTYFGYLESYDEPDEFLGPGEPTPEFGFGRVQALRLQTLIGGGARLIRFYRDDEEPVDLQYDEYTLQSAFSSVGVDPLAGVLGIQCVVLTSASRIGFAKGGVGLTVDGVEQELAEFEVGGLTAEDKFDFNGWKFVNAPLVVDDTYPLAQSAVLGQTLRIARVK